MRLVPSLLPSILAIGLLAACGGTTAAPWRVAAVVPEARVIEDGDYVPYVAGDFARVYAPSGSRYLNDHTLARGPDGTWHLYGITAATQGTPSYERAFLHATAPSPLGPWTERPDILRADDDSSESVLWAPYVIGLGPRGWSMYYWAGTEGSTSAPPRGLRRADSANLGRWTRRSNRPPGGRDPFLLRVSDRWLLYSVGVDSRSRGQILVSEGRDLDDDRGWTTPMPVVTDPLPGAPWGNLESPFVVRYFGRYYLFVTRIGMGARQHVASYDRTVVFRSTDPTRFEWLPIADLRAHAAEIVATKGRYFITSAGWTSEVGEQGRGLSIAPMRWARQ